MRISASGDTCFQLSGTGIHHVKTRKLLGASPRTCSRAVGTRSIAMSELGPSLADVVPAQGKFSEHLYRADAIIQQLGSGAVQDVSQRSTFSVFAVARK